MTEIFIWLPALTCALNAEVDVDLSMWITTAVNAGLFLIIAKELKGVPTPRRADPKKPESESDPRKRKVSSVTDERNPLKLADDETDALCRTPLIPLSFKISAHGQRK